MGRHDTVASGKRGHYIGQACRILLYALLLLHAEVQLLNCVSANFSWITNGGVTHSVIVPLSIF